MSNLLALTMVSLFAVVWPLAPVCAGDPTEADKPAPLIVELPRPNSRTFSFAQAEARKSEILSNAPTSRLDKWSNPYTGFCIHITTNDGITHHGHSLKGLPGNAEPRIDQSASVNGVWFSSPSSLER